MKVLIPLFVGLFLFAGTAFATPPRAQASDPVDINVVIVVNDLVLGQDPPVYSRKILDDGIQVVVKTARGWMFTITYNAFVVSVDGRLTILVRPDGVLGIGKSETFEDFGLDGRVEKGSQAKYHHAINALKMHLNYTGL